MPPRSALNDGMDLSSAWSPCARSRLQTVYRLGHRHSGPLVSITAYLYLEHAGCRCVSALAELAYAASGPARQM
jgi:hypothetical protein